MGKTFLIFNNVWTASTLIVSASMADGRAGSGRTRPPDAALLLEIELTGVQ